MQVLLHVCLSCSKYGVHWRGTLTAALSTQLLGGDSHACLKCGEDKSGVRVSRSTYVEEHLECIELRVHKLASALGARARVLRSSFISLPRSLAYSKAERQRADTFKIRYRNDLVIRES